MSTDLSIVERLAPDQAALKAAAGTAKPTKWPLLARSADGALVWGECQGSGANPYRVMVDTQDLGNKCTCPSRKFPCKHVLALMLLTNTSSGASFDTAEPPPWVIEWLGRRRKPGSSTRAATAAPVGEKNLSAALAEELPAAEDPAAAQRRIAAAQKRAADTRGLVLDGLEELEQWLADQLRLGLASFLGDPIARCRRIAARLVDAKAAALAGRIDETPARLLALATEERPHAAVAELGRLLLLARAFRADPGDAELKRLIIGAENRDELLANPAALRATGLWEVAGEHVFTRRDGLIAQETWLLGLADAGPRFALLLDFFPAGTGRRAASFAAGDQFEATLVFFPARVPGRAIIDQRQGAGARPRAPWPALAPADPLDQYAAALAAAPWTLDHPILLPPGRLAADSQGRAWWRDDRETAALPLVGTPSDIARGAHLDAAVAIWTGTQARLLSAETPWGCIDGGA
ncbi:SWIM zinc finger family protein [Reyranella sp. CPCC 100927]|uniref:SWIM zinc finger family protein n=1 Tax=Reyranella sp. CPCC 100927 TaxID=2599616 RepID=UPI0011B525F1|nr:SWIM zinc finger family protein [Reyranella sp. CPCC 100927]TWT14087.1 SWIM zinc finger family protein [Reyranella sp. CPCC 100927]